MRIVYQYMTGMLLQADGRTKQLDQAAGAIAGIFYQVEEASALPEEGSTISFNLPDNEDDDYVSFRVEWSDKQFFERHTIVSLTLAEHQIEVEDFIKMLKDYWFDWDEVQLWASGRTTVFPEK